MLKADQKNYLQLNQKKQQLGKVDPIEVELMVMDDDCLMSSPFRICSECGQNHGLSNNFEGVKTSIEALTELFPKYFKVKGL